MSYIEGLLEIVFPGGTNLNASCKEGALKGRS
jgi:hypothetical protein